MKAGTLVKILTLVLVVPSSLLVLPSFSCKKLGITPETPCDTVWFEHFNYWTDRWESCSEDSGSIFSDGPTNNARPCLRIASKYSRSCGPWIYGSIEMEPPPAHIYTHVKLTFWIKIEIKPGKDDFKSLRGIITASSCGSSLFLEDTIWQASLSSLQTGKWIKIEKDIIDLWNLQRSEKLVNIYFYFKISAYADTSKVVKVNILLDEVVITAMPSER